jgi:thiol-disulfide isomerase/thioredoxin
MGAGAPPQGGPVRPPGITLGRMISTAALALLAALSATPGAPDPDDVSDDYPRALERARERKVPILVDVWAPWCPPCRYMQGYVMRSPALAGLGKRVVRLEVNTELPANGPFVERYPIDAWPSLLVIDPVEERVVLRWTGSATVAEVERFARDGERALSRARAGKADGALARADELYARRRYADAAGAFQEALDMGGVRWRRRGLAAEKWVQALAFAGDATACARGAVQALEVLAPGPGARAVAEGLECAATVTDPDARRRAVEALERGARTTLAGRGLTPDDRSGVHEALVEAREALGDEAGARAEAGRWLAYLEAVAARAPTPLARSAFDAARGAAAVRLGQPGRALPALRASVRDLPGDFAPLASLAGLYLAMKQPADALDAADRALALAQGPRRVRVLVIRAQAQEALGRTGDARTTAEEAVRVGEGFPEALRPRTPVKQAREVLERLGPVGG